MNELERIGHEVEREGKSIQYLGGREALGWLCRTAEATPQEISLILGRLSALRDRLVMERERRR